MKEVRRCQMATSRCVIVSAQVSYLDKIDCDPVFGGLVTEVGAGCRTCNPGFTFVKRPGPGQEAAMKTIETACRTRPHAGVTVENKTSWQHCGECPEGAAKCNATAVHMSPGCLPYKALGCMLHVTWTTLVSFILVSNLLVLFVTSCDTRPIFTGSLFDVQGLMVDARNITRSLHCPNPLACPGGLLAANESKPMCDPGGVKETCGVEYDPMSPLAWHVSW